MLLMKRSSSCALSLPLPPLVSAVVCVRLVLRVFYQSCPRTLLWAYRRSPGGPIPVSTRDSLQVILQGISFPCTGTGEKCNYERLDMGLATLLYLYVAHTHESQGNEGHWWYRLQPGHASLLDSGPNG